MSSDFITTTELTEKLGSSAATSRGTAVITAACDIVRTLTEQTLSPVGTATISLDGTGTDALLLPERPVLNAGTVVEGGGTLTLNSDYELGADGILYRKPGLIDNGWGTETLRTYWWPGRQNVDVTFEYGYSSVPADLKEVALSIASRLFRWSAGNVTEEELGQYRVRYSDTGSSGDLTSTEKIILRKHKQAK